MRWGDLAELVRAPAAMTVPGDSWSGAAHLPAGTGGWLMPLASTCLYWSGMAFNDWCDRAVDAVERPERPIPSGRVSPATALAAAAGLAAAGVAVSGAVGGRRALAVSLPLAGLIGAYDGVAKDSRLGPLVMASTRSLDVLLGAYAGPTQAWAPALAMGSHTVGLTTLSRGEVHGSTPGVAAGVTATTLAVAAGTA
jgi:4-hydroxybenzoate polyprenyltransferase